MTVVSSKEFACNQKKYFNMAIDDHVVIKRGKNMFHLIYAPANESNIPEQPVLEPDDDLRRAISIDELRKSAHDHIHQLFANK